MSISGSFQQTASSAAWRSAWQAALAAEHRAAYGYPLLGPKLSGAQRELARSGQAAHEALRDTTAARIAAAGLVPVAALGDYADLYPVDGPKAAGALAARLEDSCAASWRFLYAQAASATPAGATSPPPSTLRAQAQSALTASAVRATRWRVATGQSPATTPFPGL